MTQQNGPAALVYTRQAIPQLALRRELGPQLGGRNRGLLAPARLLSRVIAEL